MKITKISISPNADVYDISVPTTSNFYANGILVHNCGEIALRSNGVCNLTEVNASKCSTREEFLDAVKTATIIGTLQASYTEFSYVSPKWKKTAEEDSLLGVSITGQAEAVDLLTPELLSEAAVLSVEVNKEWSAKLGIKPAKRITTVKPSGTASSWLETTSGIHAAHGRRYIRRVRMPSTSALGKKLKETFGSFVVADPFNSADIVIQIPIEFTAKNIVLRDKETAIDCLERVKKVYNAWILPGHVEGDNTHNISLTINYHEHEKDAIKNWMVENKNSYYGISLIPFDGADYKYAPYLFVHDEIYELIKGTFTEIEKTFLFEDVIEDRDYTEKKGEAACAGGACAIGD
jgi:ribonucleoside-triphosphate reductase